MCGVSNKVWASGTGQVAHTVVGVELAMVVNPALAPCADGGYSQHAVEDHLAPVLEERLVVRGIVARALDLSTTTPLASDLEKNATHLIS